MLGRRGKIEIEGDSVEVGNLRNNLVTMMRGHLWPGHDCSYVGHAIVRSDSCEVREGTKSRVCI